MARSLTARFGLQRWTANGDTQDRVDFDNDNAAVELLGGIMRQGTLAARGSATTWERSTYRDTGTGEIHYSDGVAWSRTGLPAGFEGTFAGPVAPPGWLLEYGQLLLRADQPDLFANIGTTHNTGGELATQFRVPDMRGRAPVGMDNMGGTDAGRLAEANVLGLPIGSETVTLTAAQSGLPAHTHATDSQGLHAHAPAGGTGQAFALTGFTTQAGSGGSWAAINGVANTTDNAGNHSHTAQANAAAGAASPTSVMQPSLTRNFIIKT